jgi:hypothetical protein
MSSSLRGGSGGVLRGGNGKKYLTSMRELKDTERQGCDDKMIPLIVTGRSGKPS